MKADHNEYKEEIKAPDGYIRQFYVFIKDNYGIQNWAGWTIFFSFKLMQQFVCTISHYSTRSNACKEFQRLLLFLNLHLKQFTLFTTTLQVTYTMLGIYRIGKTGLKNNKIKHINQ